MQSRREALLDTANELGIYIKVALKLQDQNAIGIHLFNPTLDELEDAIQRADADMFPTIVIHYTNIAWYVR